MFPAGCFLALNTGVGRLESHMTICPRGSPRDTLLTQAQVAAILGACVKTVQRLRVSGELPYVERPLRIWRSDVERLLAARLVQKPRVKLPPPFSRPALKDLSPRAAARRMVGELSPDTREFIRRKAGRPR
jgi:hypothetical protein